MRACEILEQNPDPTAEQVREGIASNLCRCTGYQFITEAVWPRPRGCAAKSPGIRPADGRPERETL